ncbi:hypothetical protein RB598_008183 [Gaeumannomyces tritici]
MSSNPAEAAEAPILFRRGKKRKTYRQRAGDDDNNDEALAAAAPKPTAAEADDDDTSAKSAPAPAAAAADTSAGGEPEAPNSDAEEEEEEEEEEEKGLSVAEVLRLRNARRTKLRGVELRADVGPPRDDDNYAAAAAAAAAAAEADAAENAEMALVVAAAGGLTVPVSTDKIAGGVGKRFSAQTGLVGELVNRHMDEYIESELARRQAAEDAAKEKAGGGGGTLLFSRATGQARQQQQPSLMSKWARPSLDDGGGDNDGALGQAAPGATALRGEALQQPALRGKLQEVDLGQEMRSRNVALTQRATMKGGGGGEDDGNDDDDDDDSAGEGGASNKPAAAAAAAAKGPQGRKRRASDDAIRDKMVEEFLRENKVDMYDMADQEERDGEMAHDDRVAEQFRREFFEAMSQRNRRRRPAINHHKRPSTRKEEEILKGPKLGGSRNERAHMRDILLKQANEKREASKHL